MVETNWVTQYKNKCDFVQTSGTCNSIRQTKYNKYCFLEMNALSLDHASDDSSLFLEDG